MTETIERLAGADDRNLPRAFTVVSEAVWWVTIVDATLVRHAPDAYDAALASQPAEQRGVIEGTLAGLRFVRNQIGAGADVTEFIGPARGSARGGITSWTWRQLAEPELAALPPRGRDWEMRRYKDYQAQLAGHVIGEAFARDAAFLKFAAGPLIADRAHGRPDAVPAGRRARRGRREAS